MLVNFAQLCSPFHLGLLCRLFNQHFSLSCFFFNSSLVLCAQNTVASLFCVPGSFLLSKSVLQLSTVLFCNYINVALFSFHRHVRCYQKYVQCFVHNVVILENGLRFCHSDIKTGFPRLLESPGFFSWKFQDLESPGKSLQWSWKVLESPGKISLKVMHFSSSQRRKWWTDSSQSGAGQQAPGTGKRLNCFYKSLHVYRDHM